MRKFLILTPVLLSACGEDEGASLERRFAMVEAQGTYGEICEASRAVTDYYLRSEDKEKYEHWHSWSASHCFRASLNGWNSDPRED